jgi:hypothetical protein
MLHAPVELALDWPAYQQVMRPDDGGHRAVMLVVSFA